MIWGNGSPCISKLESVLYNAKKGTIVALPQVNNSALKCNIFVKWSFYVDSHMKVWVEDIVDVLSTPGWVHTVEDFDLYHVGAKVAIEFFLLAD
jgi:hypothetical protein